MQLILHHPFLSKYLKITDVKNIPKTFVKYEKYTHGKLLFGFKFTSKHRITKDSHTVLSK